MLCPPALLQKAGARPALLLACNPAQLMDKLQLSADLTSAQPPRLSSVSTPCAPLSHVATQPPTAGHRRSAAVSQVT